MVKVRDHKGRIKRVPEGSDLEVVAANPREKWKCTPTIQKKVAALYAGGMTLKAAAAEIGYPEHTLYNWIQDVPSFPELLKGALIAKGFQAADRAMEIAEADKGFSSESVASSRLKVDLHRWLAESCAPDTFGKKTKVTGDINVAHTFIIETGIRRDHKEDPIEVPNTTQEK